MNNLISLILNFKTLLIILSLAFGFLFFEILELTIIFQDLSF